MAGYNDFYLNSLTPQQNPNDQWNQYLSGRRQSILDQPFGFQPTEGLSGLKAKSGLSGSDTNSALDFAHLLGRLADTTYGKYEPVEDWSLKFLGDVASGGGQYLNRLLAPGFAALSSQLPQAQRRLRDTTPMGGGQIEALQGLEENLQGSQSQLTSQIMNAALSRLLDTGLGVTNRIYPLLASAGQIAKKPASGGGGGMS